MGNLALGTAPYDKEYIYSSLHDLRQVDEWGPPTEVEDVWFPPPDWLELPVETWSGVLSYLSLQEQVSLSSSCRLLRQVVLTKVLICLRTERLRLPVLPLEYTEARQKTLLWARLQSAARQELLNYEQVGLVLQLERARVGAARVDSARPLSFWDSYWAKQPEEPGLRVISTCQDLHKLAEYRQQSYTKLKLVRVCLEGQEGVIKGYCHHDCRPIKGYIDCLPPSLRHLQFVTKALRLVSSYQNDLMANGAIFTAIIRRCPLLDSVDMQFDTIKVSSFYRDYGLLGLDGFSNLSEFQFEGNWRSVSDEEFKAFISRNINLAILSLDVDTNTSANQILLANCRQLRVLKLRTSKEGSRNYKGDHRQLFSESLLGGLGSLHYLWILCDLQQGFDELLNNLHHLQNLQVLRLERVGGRVLMEDDLRSIVLALPRLRVIQLPKNFSLMATTWPLFIQELPVTLDQVYQRQVGGMGEESLETIFDRRSSELGPAQS